MTILLVAGGRPVRADDEALRAELEAVRQEMHQLHQEVRDLREENAVLRDRYAEWDSFEPATVDVGAPAVVADRPLVDIHGWVSQGFLFTGDNNFLAETKNGSFEFSEAGLNFTTQLTDDLRLGLQILVWDLGEFGNHEFELDWAYGDYHWRDELGFRIGRVKLPFGLHNDAQDLDFVRNTVFLPFLPTYDPRLRDTTSALNGLVLYGTYGLGPTSIDYEAYAGASTFPDGEAVRETVTRAGFANIDDSGAEYLLGGRIMWHTPLEGFTLGTSYTRLDDLEFSGTLNPNVAVGAGLPTGTPVSIESPGTDIWMFSAQYTWDRWVFTAELNRTFADQDIFIFAPPLGTKIPFGSADVDSGAWYVQADYQVTDRLAAAVVYSENYADWGDKRGAESFPRSAGFQRDLTVAARYDLNDFWLVKGEVHFIEGTSLLLSTANPQGVERSWVLFALKSTFYF